MRGNSSGKRGDVRQSALWGSGNRGGELRSNALWGKGGRGAAVTCMVLAFVVPAGAIAGDRDKGSDKSKQEQAGLIAYVPQSLLDAAAANPNQKFDVIVESARTSAGRKQDSEDKGNNKRADSNDRRSDRAGDAARRYEGDVKRKFRSVPGASIEIKGKKLLKLAQDDAVISITPNSAIKSQGYENNEMWRSSIKADRLWGSLLSPAPQAPAIAVVDSGVDPSALDFGTRLVASVAICSTCSTDSTGDDQGHGTMVAALAAGSGLGRKGVAPNAPIVSIRTSNENGQSRVSDVIAAADWIIANKAQYNIRVANFSLARQDVTHPLHDPLNHAVERLWFNDVVVVTASGNHGSDVSQVRIKSPGNDPFVITAGAVDSRGTSSTGDDVVPGWSAHGFSVMGFSKPDVAAPGRYVVGPVPMLGTLALGKPDRVVNPGYMWMSGTSFSSGIVAGAAAQLLARHPDWSPDQVKGALMLTATDLRGQGWKAGVGEINVDRANSVSNPPNPNKNLYDFVNGSGGARSFDGATWQAYVAENPTWSTSTWSESSWSESTWSESSWSESTWSESTWSESTWSESTWTESTWSESTWTESTWVE
jgi:serine protease AprX